MPAIPSETLFLSDTLSLYKHPLYGKDKTLKDKHPTFFGKPVAGKNCLLD